MKYNVVSLFSGLWALILAWSKLGGFACRVRPKRNLPFARRYAPTRRPVGFIGSLPSLNAMFRVEPEEVLDAIGLKPARLIFSREGRRANLLVQRDGEEPRKTHGVHCFGSIYACQSTEAAIFLMENVRGLLSAALRHRRLPTARQRRAATSAR